MFRARFWGVIAILGALASGSALAQDNVVAPTIQPQDSWSVRETNEVKGVWKQTNLDLTVIRADSAGILLSTKLSGTDQAPVERLVGADWSRFRGVNGKEQVVNRPLDFPLNIGKSWDVGYAEDHPNRAHARETFDTKMKVIGWESITVPAGTFRALKIEGEGHWSADIAPAVTAAAVTRADQQGAASVLQTDRVVAGTVGGRLYKAFWYVPEVKRYVKTDEEYFDANGVRTEQAMEELTAFKVAH